jgi:hypothetical protein
MMPLNQLKVSNINADHLAGTQAAGQHEQDDGPIPSVADTRSGADSDQLTRLPGQKGIQVAGLGAQALCGATVGDHLGDQRCDASARHASNACS